MTDPKLSPTVLNRCKWCGEAIERIVLNDGTLDEGWQHSKPLDRLCCRTHKVAEPQVAALNGESMKADIEKQMEHDAGLISVLTEDKARLRKEHSMNPESQWIAHREYIASEVRKHHDESPDEIASFICFMKPPATEYQAAIDQLIGLVREYRESHKLHFECAEERCLLCANTDDLLSRLENRV
jgi:hypothetical protein